MKKGFLIAIGALLIIWLGSQIAKRGRGVTENAKRAEVSEKAALNAILSEPKVKDAVITDSGVLYAAVADDGTNRDGYAEYLCQILKDKNGKADRVKVVRHGSSRDKDRDNAYGVVLGESNCR
jgi:hypothetical protein